jgi:hypothetical protein
VEPKYYWIAIGLLAAILGYNMLGPTFLSMQHDILLQDIKNVSRSTEQELLRTEHNILGNLTHHRIVSNDTRDTIFKALNITD